MYKNKNWRVFYQKIVFLLVHLLNFFVFSHEMDVSSKCVRAYSRTSHIHIHNNRFTHNNFAHSNSSRNILFCCSFIPFGFNSISTFSARICVSIPSIFSAYIIPDFFCCCCRPLRPLSFPFYLSYMYLFIDNDISFQSGKMPSHQMNIHKREKMEWQ